MAGVSPVFSNEVADVVVMLAAIVVPAGSDNKAGATPSSIPVTVGAVPS